MTKLQVLNLVKGRNTLLLTLLGPGFVEKGTTVSTEVYKLDNFEIQWEATAATRFQTTDPTDEAKVRCKFINTKLVLDYIVWITISREKKILLTNSNEWVEIYRTNGVDYFEIEVEVACVLIKKEISNSTFKTLFDDEELVNFKIVVGGSNKDVNKSVGFHRAVLSAWSPVFLKMFTGAWKEKQQGEVELPLNISVIKAFKKFVYMDELPFDREVLLGLIQLGSYYMIAKLEDDAIEAVAKITNTENFYEILEFSFENKLEKLSAAMLLKSRFVDVERIAKVLLIPKELED